MTGQRRHKSTPRSSSRRVIRNRLHAFPRRLRVNRQRVDTALEFACQRRVDHAVTLDPALSAEGFRHDIESEMGFAARPVSGMALVVMGFILDTQALRRKCRGQLCRNNIVHSHRAFLWRMALRMIPKSLSSDLIRGWIPLFG